MLRVYKGIGYGKDDFSFHLTPMPYPIHISFFTPPQMVQKSNY